MSKPVRVIKSREQAEAILSRFGQPGPGTGVSYATVRDYCESRDELPQITPIDGDLKNVQRPWTTKAILAHLRPPARLLGLLELRPMHLSLEEIFLSLTTDEAAGGLEMPEEMPPAGKEAAHA